MKTFEMINYEIEQNELKIIKIFDLDIFIYEKDRVIRFNYKNIIHYIETNGNYKWIDTIIGFNFHSFQRKSPVYHIIYCILYELKDLNIIFIKELYNNYITKNKSIYSEEYINLKLTTK